MPPTNLQSSSQRDAYANHIIFATWELFCLPFTPPCPKFNTEAMFQKRVILKHTFVASRIRYRTIVLLRGPSVFPKPLYFDDALSTGLLLVALRRI